MFTDFFIKKNDVYVSSIRSRMALSYSQQMNQQSKPSDYDTFRKEMCNRWWYKASANIHPYVKHVSYALDCAVNIQALARGVIARRVVHSAMVSADPNDLQQAVLYCVNGCK